jgi:hypothetical protein
VVSAEGGGGRRRQRRLGGVLGEVDVGDGSGVSMMICWTGAPAPRRRSTPAPTPRWLARRRRVATSGELPGRERRDDDEQAAAGEDEP